METKIENPDEVIHLWNRSLIYKSASLYRGRVGGRGGLSVKKVSFKSEITRLNGRFYCISPLAKIKFESDMHS